MTVGLIHIGPVVDGLHLGVQLSIEFSLLRGIGRNLLQHGVGGGQERDNAPCQQGQ